MKRIYLDSNCFQRPFDDQRNDRIREETEAFLWIVEKMERKEIEIVSSFIHRIEADEIKDSIRRETVDSLLSEASEEVSFSPKIDSMARIISQNGISPKDSFHLASAILSEVDVFLTCDIPLIKKSKKLQLAFPILNPIEYKGVY